MIYERIKVLCKENKISVNELEKRLDIAKGSLCKIDKHKPSSEKMEMLAKELRTTSKYLLTGEETENHKKAKIDLTLSDLPLEIKECAIELNGLSEDNKKLVIQMIKSLGGK